jgi:NitT/TauT family transport system substrate-binding protein
MSGLSTLTRRSFVAGAASLSAGAASLSTGVVSLPIVARADALPPLEVLLAPTGASICLARAVESGALAKLAPAAAVQAWRDPDQLRAALVAGRAQLFSTPTHLPANLYNRGLPIKLLCQLGEGHLFLVTSESGPADLRDFKGRKVLGFFRNDMPDLVFRACARLEGLDVEKDIKLTYVQTGMEAAQMLAAGRVQTAILGEPAATMAIMMAAQQGRTLRRAVALQKIWFEKTGAKRLPMVGVAVHQKLLDDAPAIKSTLAAALPAAKDWTLNHREEAGALAERAMGMHARPFTAAIERFNIDIVSARAAKPDLEVFYKTLLEISPGALGGEIPPDDFYLDF